MVALHESALVRGGKSELRRAGWSVTRTAPWHQRNEPTLFAPTPRGKESATEKRPPCETGEATLSQGKGEKAR